MIQGSCRTIRHFFTSASFVSFKSLNLKTDCYLAVYQTRKPSRMQAPTTRYSWKDSPVQCYYITDADEADLHFDLHALHGPVGLDIEWKPNFRKGEPENPVALLQLANASTILLLHLSHMNRFPRNVQSFLEDPNIVKAGVGIQGDAQKIHKDCSVNIRNCVDLSLLARSVDNVHWKGKYREPLGLARLIGHYEDKLLLKGWVTRSNWEKPLDSAQTEYASNDAHAGYTLYTRLCDMLISLPKTPSPTCYTFDCVRGRLCESSGMTWSPFNPDYDPGPPPPPKAPKAPKPRASSSETPISSATSPQTLGKHRRKPPLAPDSGSGPSVRPPPSNPEYVKPKHPTRHRPRKRHTSTLS